MSPWCGASALGVTSQKPQESSGVFSRVDFHFGLKGSEGYRPSQDAHSTIKLHSGRGQLQELQFVCWGTEPRKTCNPMWVQFLAELYQIPQHAVFHV